MYLTVRVRRSAGRDNHGDPTPPSFHEIGGCVRWPRTSTESADYSQTVATGWMLSVPADSDLRSTDKVLLPVKGAGGWVLPASPPDSAWWDVEGDPLPWGPSPFTGAEPGIVVALTRVTG